jgi:hypothetical protein
MYSSTTKYPQVVVPLVGEDGNAYAILGRVDRALRKAGVSKDERAVFMDEAMAGDYDNLLRVVLSWVTPADYEDEDYWYDEEEEG